jgi:hypothetical protein
VSKGEEIVRIKLLIKPSPGPIWPESDSVVR